MIKIEDFNKLKQLDRIELLLKLDRIEKRADDLHFNWSYITNSLCCIIGFLTLYFLVNMKLVILLRFVPPLFAVAFVTAFVGSIYNSMNRFRYKKEECKLNNEYFKVEVKKK